MPKSEVLEKSQAGPPSRSSERKCNPNQLNIEGQQDTLQGINISHIGKRKIIFKMPFLGGYVSSLEGTMNTMNQTQTPSFFKTFANGGFSASYQSQEPATSTAFFQNLPRCHHITGIRQTLKLLAKKKNHWLYNSGKPETLIQFDLEMQHVFSILSGWVFSTSSYHWLSWPIKHHCPHDPLHPSFFSAHFANSQRKPACDIILPYHLKELSLGLFHCLQLLLQIWLKFH